MLPLSIVIVSFNELAILGRCLERVVAYARPGEAEILVIGCWNESDATLQQKFSMVRWLTVPAGTTIPHMRLTALAQSHGQRVALLEDDCLIGDDWYNTLLNSADNHQPIIGGAIEPSAYTRLRDWGIYFCEFGRFMPPFSGEVAILPGNNVAYRREVVEEILAGDRTDGFYEVFFHDEWVRSGRGLFSHPDLIVTNINHWSASYLTHTPFHHGRGYGSLRIANQPLWRRLSFALLTPLLPPLQVLRMIKQITKRQRHIAKLIQSLPWIALFYSSWAYGELLGYLFGAGKSKAHWS